VDVPRRALRPDPVAFAFLAVVALALFAVVRFPPDLRDGGPPPGVAAAPPKNVQDFAFVLNYARWAVARPDASPYTYDAHREFYRAWLGPRVSSALCFPYGWIAMLLLAPLFPLATAWAWLVWNLASAWLMGLAVRLLPGDPQSLRWARLVAVSPTAFHCLINGQTALFTTGCFAGALHLGDRARRGDLGRAMAGAAFLVALLVKPPLAAVAALALLAAGRWRPLGPAAVIAVTSALAAAWWWTPGVLLDYVTLLRRYNLVDADEIVRAGCVPWSMSNLRSVVLHAGWLDDSQAFRLSGAVLAGALAVPLVAVLRRRVWPLDAAASWVVVAYLLFAPHLSPMEDLLLVVPLARLLPAMGTGPSRALLLVGCLGPQWLNGSGLHLGELIVRGASLDALPLVGFALKLVAAAVVVDVVRRS
jgi:hypothetical protein